MGELKRYSDTSDTTSRYRYQSRIVYSDGLSVQETFITPEIPYSSEDIFYKVESNCVNRLDLISFKFYNSPLYWWLIALATGLDDPLVVPVGKVLRIPPISMSVDLRRFL